MFAATTSPWYLPTWVSCQMPLTSPIAHRRSPARQPGVDRDPVAVGLDADRLQADPVDARAPAGGDEQTVAPQLAAVVELEDVVVALAPRGGRVHSERELDAVAAQHLAERLAQRRRLARKHVLASLDEHHLAAEAAHGLRHLDADRAAAEHQQPARNLLHAGHLAVCPDALQLAQSRHRRHDRVGARGEDDVLGRVPHAVDLDDTDAGETAAAAKQVDAVIRQPALLTGVGVVRDHEVAPRERGLDVDLRSPRRVVRGPDRLAGTQQRLRRDARPVGALAPDQLALDERDTQPAFGERADTVLAGRTAADDDHVVVAHVGNSVPACSATMYAAYQSGQFSSRCPVRFSCSP